LIPDTARLPEGIHISAAVHLQALQTSLKFPLYWINHAVPSLFLFYHAEVSAAVFLQLYLKGEIVYYLRMPDPLQAEFSLQFCFCLKKITREQLLDY
jgi:hypothetical protein